MKLDVKKVTKGREELQTDAIGDQLGFGVTDKQTHAIKLCCTT